MNKFIGSVLLTLAITLFTGCAAVYVPHTANTMIFNKKDDIQTIGYLGWDGLGVDVGHAINDQLAYTIGGSFYQYKSRFRTIGNGSVVLYRNPGDFHTSISAGMSVSKMKVKLFFLAGRVSGSQTSLGIARPFVRSLYWRPYSQITVAHSWPNKTIGGVFRMAYVHYDSYEQSFDPHIGLPKVWHMEPALFMDIKMGLRLHLHLQSQLSIPVYGKANSNIHFSFINMTIGFKYYIFP